MSPYNAFITLTYDQKHLPPDSSLDKQHFVKFIKRLRSDLVEQSAQAKLEHAPRISYFHCGEYGDNEDNPGVLGRPHYHACIFNWDFPDKTPWKQRNGYQVWRSKQLERLWPSGQSEVGSLTLQSAGYVSRYIMSKLNGDKADAAYLDKKTGTIKQAPYITMSTKPAIGKTWFNKYHSEVYPLDEVISNGHKSRPPKYYDLLYKQLNPTGHLELKGKRIAKAKEHEDDNTPERLAVKEEVLKAKTSTLKRTLK